MTTRTLKVRPPKVRPKLSHYEVDSSFPFLQPILVKNTELYTLVERLVEDIEPSIIGEYDRLWFSIYLPLRRFGREIAVPMWVKKLKTRGTRQSKFIFGISMRSYVEILRGKEEYDQIYKDIILEATRFMQQFVKADSSIVRKMVPYDYREGRIQRKYVVEEGLMSHEEKQKILMAYKKHQSKNLTAKNGCSLNEYLNIAAICYKAAFGEKAQGKTPSELYEAFADKRHGGMMFIKNKDSKEEFSNWCDKGIDPGSHPFEIVYSGIEHGIHLLPPAEHNGWKYVLRVTNYSYAKAFIRMVCALIRHDVPFQAYDLEDVLDYLTGEMYLSVNEYGEPWNTWHYIPSKEYKKKYFKKVEWAPLELPRWKTDKRASDRS